ncbi:DUF397 domain-containing protein [Streptomyces sp. NPDC056653]|uniref:DUF397 domain-containing protein n=1 Tax=Streptomyces sp. NPDC056653 TaxID=3345894 RepID=UPI0036CF3B4E
MPRTNIEVPGSAWFKSSYSGGNETECVEAAFTAAGTSVRDSKRPDKHDLRVRSAAWESFIDAVRNEQLG